MKSKLTVRCDHDGLTWYGPFFPTAGRVEHRYPDRVRSNFSQMLRVPRRKSDIAFCALFLMIMKQRPRRNDDGTFRPVAVEKVEQTRRFGRVSVNLNLSAPDQLFWS